MNLIANQRYNPFDDYIQNFQGYNGNPLIKKAGVQIQWTPEMLEEFFKCQEDPIYFAEKYMKILVKGKGLMPITLFPYQKEMILAMKDKRYNVFATARQAGKCLVGETRVKVKFLDSPPVNIQIKTIHEIIACINKYKQLYIEDLDVLEQQIHTHLLQLNRKEASKFVKLWRGASYSAKINWWNQLSFKYDYVKSKRTHGMSQTFAKNAGNEQQRMEIYDTCQMDDDSYTKGNENYIIPSISNSKRTNSRNQQRECWRKEPILWEGTQNSSSWVCRQTENTRTKRQNFNIHEIEMGYYRTSGESVSRIKNFSKISTSNVCQNNISRTPTKDDNWQTEILSKTHTSYQRNNTNGGSSKEIKFGYNRETEKRTDQTTNERCMETPKRKFIESFFELGFFIQSDTGYVPISESHKTIKYQIWSLQTKNHKICCADDHIVFDQNTNEVFVKNLNVGDYIQTKNGLEKIQSIEQTPQFVHMYDLGVHHQNHRYYSNGILSHNSTVVCAFVLWYMIFSDFKPIIAFLANKGETAEEILKKVKLAYENLPKWLQHGVIKWNEGEIELENGSRAIAKATSSDSIRGFAIDLLFVDEAAFVENWDKFWPSTYNTISSTDSTKVVLVSTPNGLNHFYSIWELAQRVGTDDWNEFNAVKVTWEQVPGRDQKWYNTTLKGLNFDQDKFNQEHCVRFDTHITVKDKLTGEIKNITIEELYKLLKS